MKQLEKKRLSTTATYTARRTTVKTSTLGHDPLASFLLTFRFFLQDNEACSLRRLAVIYDDDSLAIPEDLRKRFRRIRSAFNAFLDSSSAIGLLVPDGTTPPGFLPSSGWPVAITRRMVLEAFMWGDLAHATHERSGPHRALREWFKKDPLIEPVARNQLIWSLGDLAGFITLMRDVNLLTLAHLDGAPVSP